MDFISKKISTTSFRFVSDARAYLKNKVEKGNEPVVCPCCDRLVKVYKRNVNSKMSIALIKLVKLYRENNDYYHIDNFDNNRGGDFAKLRYWGLVEEKLNTMTNVRSSGYWKPTSRGINFVDNKVSIPKYAFVYNRELRGFSHDVVSIPKTLGNRFDYSKLMEK